MSRPPDPAEPLLVACLCAAWCRVCDDWRASFDALAAEFPQAVWLWVDVEDEADALGDFDPENFPVLAVQRGDRLLYCAALPPHALTWKRLLENCGCDASMRAAGPDLRRLLQPARGAG
jgi:hypothetical protein